jgi:hypothetical protein
MADELKDENEEIEIDNDRMQIDSSIIKPKFQQRSTYNGFYQNQDQEII